MASSADLELAMPAFEVMFLASGAAPYALAWGNRDAQAPDNALQKIIDKDQQAKSAAALVRLGPTVLQGDANRLLAEPSSPLLKWLLWIVLTAVIVFAGRMAYKLYQEIGRHKPSE